MKMREPQDSELRDLIEGLKADGEESQGDPEMMK